MTATPHQARMASLRTRSAVARVFIGLFLVVDLLLALFAALLLYREVTTRISFFMVALPGFLFLIALPLLASGLALMVWVHRAHDNLRAETLEGLNFAPGWAATSFVIPVAGLIVPFQAMRELWNRSHGEPEHFARVSVASMCFGPSRAAVRNGRLMLALITPESSIFAFSAASSTRCIATGSRRRSIFCSRLKLSIR